MSRNRITLSLGRFFKASALTCFWVTTNLKHLVGRVPETRRSRRNTLLLFLCFRDYKLISEPVGGKAGEGWMDGWKIEAGGVMAGLISRSDKPEGLIANIPHFRVNYNMEMQRGEY